MDESKTGYGVTHMLSETAELLGISRERVRQIEKKALEKVRMQLKLRFALRLCRQFSDKNKDFKWNAACKSKRGFAEVNEGLRS